MNRKTQRALILLLILGLPLFVWFYLDKGTQMRKSAMDHLSPKAEMGNFQTVTEKDSLYYSHSLQGKRWIIGIIGADSLREKHVQVLKDLTRQAKEEFTVNVFTIIGLYQGELISEMSEKLKISSESDWVKTYMASNHVFKFGADAFSVPDSHANQNIIALLDPEGRMRNYYRLSDPEDIKTAVREIPVFLSLKK